MMHQLTDFQKISLTKFMVAISRPAPTVLYMPTVIDLHLHGAVHAHSYRPPSPLVSTPISLLADNRMFVRLRSASDAGACRCRSFQSFRKRFVYKTQLVK
jgi:hypothetical protein